MRDGLEGERVNLLHDLGSPLHLLALKTQKTLLSVVQLGQLAPGGGVVEHSVVLGTNTKFKSVNYPSD